jgi:hypothetical protein
MRGGEMTSLRIIAIGGGQEKDTELEMIREFAR